VVYDEVPRFLPEAFAVLRNQDIGKLKSFEKGVAQLCQEGLVDLLWDPKSGRREPIIAVVGKLQFDVLQHRLMAEYGVRTVLEPMPFELMRWMDGSPAAIQGIYWGGRGKALEDDQGRPVAVFSNEWALNYIQGANEGVRFLTAPPA
jgi:peptide chain release factor 3